MHTPGPWSVENTAYDSTAFYIRGSKADGSPMTFGLGAVAHIPRSTRLPSKANARLIAAAPELLEALETIIELASWFEGTRAEAIAKARAAIAKATGR